MSKKDFVRDSAGHENYGAMIDDVTNMSHLSDWDQMKKLAHERSLTKRASFHSAAYDLVKQKVDATNSGWPGASSSCCRIAGSANERGG